MKEGTATVVKNAGSHYLLSELPVWAPFPAVLKGKVRLGGSGSTNPVAVGDRVRYSFEGEPTVLEPARIGEILDRSNYVIRRPSNLSRTSHVIAANVDGAFIVVSLYCPRIKLPFLDRILVTCGAPTVPDQLVSQLKSGGIMVVPVGDESQEMVRLEKRGDGPTDIVQRRYGDCNFVPMLEKTDFGRL